MKNLYTTKISLAFFLSFLLCQFLTNAQWSKQIIEEKLNQPTSFFPGDIDRDGDEDFVAAIFGQKDIVWYEYDNSAWIKHLVDNNLGAVGLFIIDLDKDEKNDIVAAGFASNAVKWYKNSGETPVGWTGNVIDNSLSGAEWVSVADIDSDDDLDVVATGSNGDCVVWYENDGSCTSWTKHFVDQNLDGALVCQVIDIDGDKNPDIIANGMFDGVLAWYKNGNSGKDWTKNTIDNLPGISEFDIADMDNDNDFDIVASGTNNNEVVLFENKGGETLNWTRHVIDGNLGGAFAVEFADMDGDTIQDVVATGNKSSQVVWYKNNGDSPDTWSKTVIDPAFPDAWDAMTIDVDGKGYSDVIVNQFIVNGSIVQYKNPLGVGTNNIESDIIDLKINISSNNGFVHFSMDNPQKTILKIYNIQGKVLYQKVIQTNHELVDMSMCSKGIYLINLSQNGKTICRKFMLH